MIGQNYPILEFDPECEAKIEPSKVYRQKDVPEVCVFSFFREVMQNVIEEHQAKVLLENPWEDGPHPLYEITWQERRVGICHPGVGGAMAAALLEELIAFGCRKFIVCGGCGALERGMAVGNLVVVTSAVRDEGVSYHYMPPGREVQADARGVAALQSVLDRRGVPYRLGKTWTTDAPYRETEAKIALRKAEGCCTVEMEAASFMAVAAFRGVPLGQVLYAGDDLSGSEWDKRGWETRTDVRRSMFWIAVEAALAMQD